MTTSRHTVLASIGALLALLVPAPAGAGDDGQARRNFIACPLVRNTYVPCWLAEHEGELYYLGPQGDLGAEFHPPQLGHRTLIEGVAALDRERVCGGIVLEPVHISVLPELDRSCNAILPAAGYSSPDAHRTPGPNNSAREPREPREAFAPPFAERTFEVPFAFDVGDSLYSWESAHVVQASRYARAADAGAVRIIGWRGAALLSDGTYLEERPGIAATRAAMVERMLVHAGVPADCISTSARDAERADGVNDHELRRATIVVEP